MLKMYYCVPLQMKLVLLGLSLLGFLSSARANYWLCKFHIYFMFERVYLSAAEVEMEIKVHLRSLCVSAVIVPSRHKVHMVAQGDRTFGP